jgi:sugar phosphate isomerase/epimerase
MIAVRRRRCVLTVSPCHRVTVSPGHPIGVASHLFRGSPAEVAGLCRRHGLTCVKLAPSFPGLSFYQPGDITPERCRHVAEPFAREGIAVACLWAAVNLLDPDLDRRHRGIVRLHALLRHGRDFGTEYLITETGSLNPVGASGPFPEDRSREAWRELRLILSEALRVADGAGVTLLLKAEGSHVLATLDDALRLRDELPHPRLGFVLDPVNYLLDSPPGELGPALERLVDRLGPWAPVVHAKDIRFEDHGATAPRAGGGVLDYGLFLRLLDRHQPGAPIILEHLCPQEVPDAVAYLRRYLA